MAAEMTDVLLIGPPKPVIVNGLARAFNLVKFSDAKDRETFFAGTAPQVRRGQALAACTSTSTRNSARTSAGTTSSIEAGRAPPRNSARTLA